MKAATLTRATLSMGYRDHRRGAAAILILTMLFVFVAVAAITVDYAYMQMLRSDLRIATDASAKAGAEALARTESESSAIDAAVDYAQQNNVGNAGLVLPRNRVILGRSTPNAQGKWVFQAGQRPFNSVKVNGEVDRSLFFGNFLGHSTYSPEHSAIAGQQEVDVCLCLDRSGSMLFDMTGVDYSYRKPNPNLSSWWWWGETWQYHLSPPHPVHSRWAVLGKAVEDFFDEVHDFNPPPRTTLVTWGSDYTMPIPPYTNFQAATTNVGLPDSESEDFEDQMDSILNAVQTLGQNPIMGSTNLSAGLDKAVQTLTTGPRARSLSNKVVILFTDGKWNYGRNPVLAAQDARNAGVVVHTVSMLTGEQSILEQVATITGGRSFTTSNETQLREAFREIARSLQVVMIE